MVIFISEEEIESLNQQIADKDEEIEKLKQQLADKDSKLKNQANELNHLTNEIIPELKKENKKLKALKVELTDALEKSTKKYFDQLEINADLSESVAKKGAGLQLAKVRLNEIEKLVVELETKNLEEEERKAAIPTEETDEDEVTKIYQEKEEEIANLHEEIVKLENDLKDKDKEIDRKEGQIKAKESKIKDKDAEIKDLNDNVIPGLKTEIAGLKNEVKGAKEEAQKELDGVGGKIAKLEAEIKGLNESLDNKKRDYDRLHTEMNAKDKTITSLKNKNQQLSDQLKEESNKGFFSKLKGR